MTEATKKLRDRGNVKPEIINIRNKVYVAVGYDDSYFSMIVGTDGVVIVDTGADPYRAASVMAQFREISDKPVKAIICTHSHPDHMGGLTGVVGMEVARDARSAEKMEIWGRTNFGSEFALARLLPQAFALRGGRQFGRMIPAEKKYPPLGPREFPEVGTDWPLAKGPIMPNRMFAEDKFTLDIAGLKLELYAAPGETTDHLLMWMADDKIAFAGDNIYGSFPNLYPVRGSEYRDVATWAASVKKIGDMQPEYLVMGHSAPLMDKATCSEWLSHYYEAIKYVFDATIEGMNKGLGMDELAETVQLPAHLAAKEYLTPYYGNVAFSVRAIFVAHLGWFDGTAYKLAALPLKEEARHMAEMGGGVDALVQRAARALADGDAAWAAQLVHYVLRLEPDRADARKINAGALDALGEAMLSTSGRNYLLSCALEAGK